MSTLRNMMAAAAITLGAGFAPLAFAGQGAAGLRGPAPDAQPAAARVQRFDLAAMALNEALTRYAALTGYSVLFESGAVAGKRSGDVRGSHSAEAALARLLAGTGLTPKFLNEHSVAVVAPPAAASRARPLEANRPFGMRLQHRIAAALCAMPHSPAGRERIALRFGIDAQGRIEQPRVSVPTLRAAEPAARDALAALEVGVPPAGMPQPFVMVVSPEAARLYGGCPS